MMSLKVGIEGVLLVVVQHPPGQNAAATRDDAGNAIAHQGQVFNQNPGVDGHVVHPLLGVLFDDVQKVVGGQLFDVAVDTLQSLVHRHRTNGDGRILNDGGADFIQITAPGGQDPSGCLPRTSPPGSALPLLR
jgi:hypothetical protein